MDGREVRTESRGVRMVDEVIRDLAGWGREVDSILSCVKSRNDLVEERHKPGWGFEKLPLAVCGGTEGKQQDWKLL